uniref:Protein kinase domain-containing protein n=1 Tax=viral metagenome TaxID=1070528 RepID=A0A6C0K206_9ZZZZ
MKKISENKYQILLADVKGNEAFFYSIFNLLNERLPGSYIVSANKEPLAIHFFSTSVKPLSYYCKKGLVDYCTTLKIICDLYKQSMFLGKYGYGFYCIDLNDIIVIDKSIFICTNPCVVKECRNGQLMFFSPFNHTAEHGFYSPEILELQSIPAKVSHKCFYYSLGALAIYCLVGEKLGNSDAALLLKPISQTKLYWLILKLVESDCERRSALII